MTSTTTDRPQRPGPASTAAEVEAYFDGMDLLMRSGTLLEAKACVEEMSEVAADLQRWGQERRTYVDALLAAVDGDRSVTWGEAHRRLQENARPATPGEEALTKGLEEAIAYFRSREDCDVCGNAHTNDVCGSEGCTCEAIGQP